ncbi:MAG TPA: ROK family protein [Roseimicrobium sp.]|nr:ROK family protein [Roseimicrobium sp.]
MNSLFLGIEIGGTKLQLVIGTADGSITDRRRFQVAKSAGGAGIREQISKALPELIAQHHPKAIGVGFGGPVDFHSGDICCSHQIEGWSEFPIGRWLRDITALPVAVDNDANTAALGEAHAGAGKGFNPVFYITMGSGVGGGLVVNGSIYHGAKPGETEIGHVRIDRDGTILEHRCSGWAVDRRVRELAAREPGGRLATLIAKDCGGEARHLGTAIAEKDPSALHLLDEVAADLAFALSHVVHLMHPSVMVLGGGLSLLSEPLRGSVAKALPGFVMEAFHPGPQVVIAGLREDSVPVGALILASGAK